MYEKCKIPLKNMYKKEHVKQRIFISLTKRVIQAASFKVQLSI